MKRWSRLWELRCRRWLLLALATATLMAAPALAATISQGYQSSSALPTGSLVALDPNASGTIVAATTSNSIQLVGVVVDSSSSLLSVSGTGANVQVVTTGTASALVSNINGDIKKGDAIAVSPIDGVGMKATAAGRIVGIAQADFGASTSGAVTKSVKSGSTTRQVAVGGIPVTLAVSEYTPKAGGSVIPPAFQNFAAGLAGKPVSTWRLIAAILLLPLGLIIVVIILNSAVRGSMESIGRNPLARSAISSGLLKVLLLTLAILLVTLGSVYFIVKG